jgi:RNase P subunit RPR2
MPQRILCPGCNASLYDGFELESPIEIIQRNNGTCPKCGRKLSFDPDSIKIVPTDQIRNQKR